MRYYRITQNEKEMSELEEDINTVKKSLLIGMYVANARQTMKDFYRI